ncbi:hypothetical protein BD289DRAFT_479325 [Coniella lustricola]|uniref:Uncharacterized protein n=1 Tax=Coniella lustricola TaxID=2025994 RepID=A0A2T3AJG6_9PEZI|nr:hypothetical protein BD289DRAFT_479325 [Coniella lustricola]
MASASVRPTTSGGLSSRGIALDDRRISKDDMFFRSSRRTVAASRNVASHRISRDDLYLPTRMTAVSQFHIPVRGQAATREHGLDYPLPHDLPMPALTRSRVHTPESTTSGDIPIGMALGSPAHIPHDSSRWLAQFPPASPGDIASPAEADQPPAMAAAAPSGSLQRKKTTRKRLFGLFGGSKKEEQPPKPAGRERGNTFSSRIAGASTSTVNLQQPPKTPTRSNTQADKRATKHKPIVLRSNTMPINSPEREPAVTQTKPHVLRKKSSDPRIPVIISPHAAAERVPPVPQMPQLSLLSVNIPDTKLERYSVMFSDVLNSAPRQDSASSLLARRQANLDRLKTVNQDTEVQVTTAEDPEKGRPRRATSPQPTKTGLSPKLSVFPMPPSGRRTPAPDTPTSATRRTTRANTSPGRLPSPTHQIFDHRPRQSNISARPRNLDVPNPFEMHPPMAGNNTQPQQPIYPTDTSFHFGPEQSNLILDSPTSMGSHDDIVVAQPYKPTLHEPQWQMVSPSATSSTGTSTSASGRRGRSESAASSSTHITKPSSDIDALDAASQNAVEVSIARQISISRQQRNLLRPLQTRRDTGEKQSPINKPAVSVAGYRSPFGVTVVKSPSPSRLAREEPIRDVSSSTPTLVHQFDSPVRKSSWALVESE